MRPSVEKCDAIVVGAGPAGSVTAALLAERGRRVVVLERDEVPRPKVCGEYLCPSTVRALDRLGLLKELDAARCRPIEGMLLVSPSGIEVETRFPGNGLGGRSMERRDLDGGLATAAVWRGAIVEWGASVTGLEIDRREVTVEVRGSDGETRRLAAPIVVGADGRFSTVARRVGLALPRSGGGRGTVHAWYRGVEGLGDRGEMHFFPDGSYLGLDPLHDGVLNAGWVTDADVVKESSRARDGAGRLRTLVGQSGNLEPRFRRAELVAQEWYLAPLRVEVSSPVADRVLLVGDAGGFLDPLTGEGIHVAVATAELAAQAVDSALEAGRFDAGFLRRYAVGRRRLLRAKGVVTRLFQWMLRRPELLDGVARRLSPRPVAADTFIGVVGNVLGPGWLLRPKFWMPLLIPAGVRRPR